LVIAHRGASRARPENTVEAFVEARRVGADMVELDARRTADGRLAVHHDAVVAGLGSICALDARELPRHVPLLDEAFDACEGMAVNVEVKNLPGDPDFEPDELVATAVVEAVQRRRLHDRLVVSSFSLAAIDRVRALDDSLVTAWLTLPGLDQHDALHTVVSRGHRGLHPHHLAVTPELVADAHGRELFVNTWTVDDPARMTWLVEAGVDGICTNVPDVLVGVLGRPT
jgi:glycerophosphoryl diester phosphodiesterase